MPTCPYTSYSTCCNLHILIAKYVTTPLIDKSSLKGVNIMLIFELINQLIAYIRYVTNIKHLFNGKLSNLARVSFACCIEQFKCRSKSVNS